MRKINKKTVIASTASVGAVAALLFGGQAVSTAFSSDSAGQSVDAQAASVAVTVGNGDIVAKNLRPGGPSYTQTVNVTNTGSDPANMTLNVGSFIAKQYGTTGAPNPSELDVNLNGQPTNAGSLQNQQGIPLLGNPFAPGQTIQFQITVSLDSSAGNDWNGAEGLLPYTIHAQDAS